MCELSKSGRSVALATLVCVELGCAGTSQPSKQLPPPEYEKVELPPYASPKRADPLDQLDDFRVEPASPDGAPGAAAESRAEPPEAANAAAPVPREPTGGEPETAETGVSGRSSASPEPAGKEPPVP